MAKRTSNSIIGACVGMLMRRRCWVLCATSALLTVAWVTAVFFCVRIWMISSFGIEFRRGALYIEYIEFSGVFPDNARRVPLEVYRSADWREVKWFPGYERFNGPWYVDRYLYIPLWMPAALSTSLSVVCWCRARPRHRAGLCPHCGYDLVGAAHDSKRCPECGAVVITVSRSPSPGTRP
jgi:hypothetical protein